MLPNLRPRSSQVRTTRHPQARNIATSIRILLLPSLGNMVFTLIALSLVVWAQAVGALPVHRPSSANTSTLSTGVIAYQGRLATPSGTPITAVLDMTFRLYTTAMGNTTFWTESWSGASRVQVTNGLFNVMLGRRTPLPPTLVTSTTSLWLGISVGSDSEMSPRVQIGSVPYAFQTLTVSDRSIEASKLNLQQDTACLTQDFITSLSSGQEVNVPGLTLSFTLAQSSTVLVWIDGMVNFDPGGPYGVKVYVDTTAVVGSGGLDSWFSVKGLRRLQLAPGTHQMRVAVNSEYNSGTLNLRGVDYVRTCIVQAGVY